MNAIAGARAGGVDLRDPGVGVGRAHKRSVQCPRLNTYVVDEVAAAAEQKAVRAADLAGLAADYATFRINTVNLWKEHALLSGTGMSWEAWVQDVGRVLKHYLAQEIRLTSYYNDDDGESAFHRAVLRNLAALREDGETPAM